ncbi:protein NRT1/ PTR FAMILY 5.6 isoform X3 [Populus trichocarpa]|uniref:protein NRT1/ PTR FAMILY 5.6 isoform X3 n=1 Tax=Populus trichocarpa TaxID=3694 RepID=UPI0022792A4F|nr:protein NRT1/ PTR FAMILY 5.6 isoform X3 [Populus trichocarpa]
MATSVQRFFSTLCRVTGCVKLHLYFTKAVFFILGLISSHSFVNNAVVFLWMVYLIDLGQLLPLATIAVNVQEGLYVICTFLIANIADAYTGPYKAIVFSTASYAFGLLLWFLANRFWGNSSSTVIILLYLMMVLATVGKASQDPCLKAFLRDQLVEHKPNLNADKDQADEVPSKPDKAKVRRKFWWRIASTVGTVSSVIMAGVSNQRMIAVISFSVMALACLTFALGKSFYYPDKPTGIPLIVIYRVLKAAFVKRHLQHAREPNDYYMNDSGGLHLLPNFRIIRWLDKAALLETSKSLSAEEQEKNRRLFSVQDVQQVKQLLAMVPMWTALPIHGLVLATGSTFFVVQSESLYSDPVFSINVLFLLQGFVTVIVPYVHDILVSGWIKKLPMHHGRTVWIQKLLKHRVGLVRIAIGIACSIICCMVSMLVETRRLNLIKTRGDAEPFPMSTVWLVPQFFLIGLVEGLVADGLADFYNVHVDESLKHYESPFNESAIGVGKFLSAALVLTLSGSWFHHTLNTSHLDKYYMLLGILSSVNLCFYLLVMYAYAWKAQVNGSPDPEVST